MATNLVCTSFEDIEKKHGRLRDGFRSGKLKSIPYRKHQLLQLIYLMKDNLERIEDALHADLGKPGLEFRLYEYNPTINEALSAYHNVEKWAKPEKPGFDFLWSNFGRATYKEAKGVVLIIGPFNYPVLMVLGPLMGAIAAGNSVFIKPAESTPAYNSLLAELVPKYLDPDIVQVANGSIPETTKILELRWDHILFTGSGRVGKIVSLAAAKHLTPVSLELGGKCPVIIDPAFPSRLLPLLARRLFLGKIVNAGQACLSPDYVLVPAATQDALVKALQAVYAEFFPEGVRAADDHGYARIISADAVRRIGNLLEKSKGRVEFGGDLDEEKRFIPPTVVSGVREDDSLMQEEIFGPILPIVPVDSVEEAIRIVNTKDHPLALYIYSLNPSFTRKVMDSTRSGGVCVNEHLILPGAEGLPFGGIGPSGSGCLTGKYAFDTFTHLRPLVVSPTWLDTFFYARFPPYTANKLMATGLLRKRIPARPLGPPCPRVGTVWGKWRKWTLFVLALALSAVYARRRNIVVG